jgi:hypothetical protein
LFLVSVLSLSLFSSWGSFGRACGFLWGHFW